MGVKEALLADVLASPDDDAPRLVYADALQSEGDPRGELIAVQCELARLGCARADTLFLEWVGDALVDAPMDERVARLRARESALLTKHGDAWAKADGYAKGRASLWRGFVERVVCDVGPKVSLAATVVALMPASAKSASVLAAFLSRPVLDHVREIYNVLDFGLEPFLGCKLPGLRRLLLSHRGGPHDLAELPRAAWASRLTGLVLNGFSLQASDIAPTLKKAAKLEELQLIDTRLGAAAVAALAELPFVPSLRVLAVRHGRLAAGEAIPLLTKAKSLRALDLRTNKLGAADTKLLGAGFASLAALDLGNNPLDQDAIAKLVGGRGLGALRSLALEKSGLDDAALATLAKSRLIGQLRTLDLRKNAITDAGAKSLVRARSLRTLYLGGNKLTPKGKKALKAALPDTRLYA